LAVDFINIHPFGLADTFKFPLRYYAQAGNKAGMKLKRTIVQDKV